MSEEWTKEQQREREEYGQAQYVLGAGTELARAKPLVEAGERLGKEKIDNAMMDLVALALAKYLKRGER